MTDLETRLRTGLSAPNDPRAADAFLDDVRRGAARRRARRTAAGAVAATIMAVAAIAAVTTLPHGERTAPPADSTTAPTNALTTDLPKAPHLPAGASEGVIDISVTDAGEVYRLTTNVGCAACSTIWVRAQDGSWAHLFDFEGRTAYSGSKPDPLFGPVEYLSMAPDGKDGWAWGQRLWSTHDGGHSWTIVTDGPGAPTDRGHWVWPGRDVAWSLHTTSDGTQTLFRTPIGSDDWKSVSAPVFGDVAGVLGDDRVVLQATDTHVIPVRGSWLAIGDGTNWSQPMSPCPADARVRVEGTAVFTACPVGGPTVTVRRWVPSPASRAARVGWATLGSVAGQGWLPLDADRVLIDRADPSVLDASGAHPTDLHLGGDRILDVSTADGQSWLVTFGHHLWSSTDGGASWTSRD